MTLVADRVGDYVHCLGRLVNTACGFLATAIPEASVRGSLRGVLERASSAAHHATPVERVVPSSQRSALLDLTTVLFLLRSPDTQAQIVQAMRPATLPVLVFRESPLAFHAAILLLLRAFGALLTAWAQEAPLSESDLIALDVQIRQVAALWRALKWRVTPWLHWTATGCCWRQASPLTLARAVGWQ